MESMNISLPDPLKRFVDSQIAAGRYSSVSEYIRELIRMDEGRKAQERLEGLLLEGLDSSGSIMKDGDWLALKSRVLKGRKKRANR